MKNEYSRSLQCAVAITKRVRSYIRHNRSLTADLIAMSIDSERICFRKYNLLNLNIFILLVLLQRSVILYVYKNSAAIKIG